MLLLNESLFNITELQNSFIAEVTHDKKPSHI